MMKLNNAVFLDFYKINGAVIDALEYFLFLYTIDSSTKFIVFNRHSKTNAPPLSSIFKMINDRYILPDDSWKNNIILYNKSYSFIKEKYNVALILDRSTLNYASLINCKKMIIFHDYCDDRKIHSLYDKLSTIDHMKIYHEMPFATTLEYSTQTNLKMAFSLFKYKITLSLPHYYTNCCSKGVDQIQRILDYIPEDSKLMVTGNDININNSRLIVYPSHPNNFFNLFSYYIYFHDKKYFDPRPRLFHECTFYNKCIIYNNETNIKDGSWYRYNDAKNTKSIKERTLTIDDTLIKEMIG